MVCIRKKLSNGFATFWSGQSAPRARSHHQADHGRLEELAVLEGRKPVAKGRCWCHRPRWDRGPRPHVRTRRLTAASLKFPYSPCLQQNCIARLSLRHVCIYAPGGTRMVGAVLVDAGTDEEGLLSVSVVSSLNDLGGRDAEPPKLGGAVTATVHPN